MPTVRVTALKDFDHDGHPVTAGELVTMSPVAASIAARHGHVSLSPSLNARTLEAETANESARPRRRYRRRDMQAESTE